MMNVNFPKKEHIYCDLLCRYEKRCTFVVQKHKKQMKRVLSILLVVALFMAGCTPDNGGNENVGGAEGTTLTVSLEQTRTSLGDDNDSGIYPTYWSIGDRIVVNGVVSDEVSANENGKPAATFNFGAEELTYPYNVTYPYCALSTAEKFYVEFPAVQSYVKGTISPNSAPMCGYAEEGDNIVLNHLATVLRIPVRAASEKAALKEVVVSSTSGNKLSGIFVVDCKNTTISATGSRSLSSEVPLG